ncbi:hypothetical protein [Sphingomonas kyeonggiensis]|uniref:Uncharacterized protein n=1 Tax=Sphingomonas kyeonggiensis TaxID=1268553 RepID=A0A7W6JWL0_9SPHN|nr:hypothetical protein [Sphingomonas kyeonggiensis]MBB4099785.1 hypothetical protein [Sphingomonas kyeonggiensis]
MNILQQFIAVREQRAKQAITNEAQPAITRAEFATLVKAVEGLVQDMEVLTSPEKLAGVFNAALKEAMPATNGRRPLALPADRHAYLAPPGDEPELRTNGGPAERKPLALSADHGFLAPAGE